VEFVRAKLEYEGSSLAVRPLGNQASGSTTTMAQADALIIVRPEAGQLAAGDEADVVRLADV
jgi:molybdopterin biosynthesis enzyme